MDKKITKLILLFSLLVLLVGITSAATFNNHTDTSKISGTSNTNKIIKENADRGTQNNELQKVSDKKVEKDLISKDKTTKKDVDSKIKITDNTKFNNSIEKVVNPQETDKKDILSSLLFGNLGNSVTIILPANANDNVTINVDGFAYSFKALGSVSNMTGTYMPTGVYQYAFDYAGDKTHQPFSKSGTINVTNKNDTGTPHLVHNVTKNIEMNVIDEGNGIVTVEYDGKKSSLKIGHSAVAILASYMPSGKYQFLLNYTGNSRYPSFHIKGIMAISIKYRTKITLKPIWGVIGEKITLNATVTDSYGRLINGGNLIFKLNGKTLRTDGRFDSTAPAMKFSVKNGQVFHTITADLYLRNTKNLTASYSGAKKYTEEKSPTVVAQIRKRNSVVTVTNTPSKAKQYEILTFTVTAKDVTKNAKNTTAITENTKAMLKINGNTLKDNKGQTVYINFNKNAQATYKYIIPAGMAGITGSKVARNYIVTAVFEGDNYYPGSKNDTSFQVERSPTTVTISQAEVTSGNLLSVKATIKDYKGNNVVGTNKYTIKVNGKSYTKNGKAVYWNAKNGVIDLSGIQIDPKTTIKRVMVVTGERQAYAEGRAETNTILRV